MDHVIPKAGALQPDEGSGVQLIRSELLMFTSQMLASWTGQKFNRGWKATRHRLQLLYWRNRTGVKYENTIYGMPFSTTALFCTHNATFERGNGGEEKRKGDSR